MTSKKVVDVNTLKAYPERFCLIPLYPYDAVSTKHGHARKDGKRPADYNWPTRNYERGRVLARAKAGGNNVGVRAKEADLFFDVDPRNGGDVSWPALCKSMKVDPAIFPRVITGSGGSHYYATKPPGVLVVDTLEDFPGVEFKSKGRQIVAAGSIHPDTLKPYTLDPARPPLDRAPVCPTALLDVIRRPERSVTTGGGDWSVEEIARALEALDVMEFTGNADWGKLMMGCHFASGGDARDEFIHWSVGDPKFKGAEYAIGFRWDSCNKMKSGARTGETIKYYLRKFNKASAMPPNNAADDFEFESIEESHDGAEAFDNAAVSALSELSQIYCTVIDGDFRVMHLEENAEMPGRRCWKSTNPKAFIEHFSNRRIQRDTTGMSRGAAATVPLGKAWIEWSGRPSAVGITFDTTASPAEDIKARIVKGRLNLWTGWGCAPTFKQDGCKFLERMIREDLCDSNEEVYRYVMKWIAFKIQNPTLPCFTSLVFRGAKGAGKTTLGGEVMVPIFGSHGLVVSRRDQFVGQFSGHLAAVSFIFADEAVWGGHKEDEGILKQLITDRHRLYRAMYKEASYGVNRVGLMMATNEAWAAPASFDERRFMVQDVSARHVVPQDAPADHPNRLYWNAIYSELNNGGREAFFHDVQAMKLGDWTPNVGVPRTAALAAQIEEGMRGIDRWYYEMVTEGELPYPTGDDAPDWEEKGQLITYGALLQSCRLWMRDHNQQALVSPRGLGKKLLAFGWTRGRNNAAKGLVAPSFKEAVAALEKRLGHKLDG